jgi:hypothetical protein
MTLSTTVLLVKANSSSASSYISHNSQTLHTLLSQNEDIKDNKFIYMICELFEYYPSI